MASQGQGRPKGSSGPSSAATNVSGKSAMHPTMGMTWKRALKLEKIARLSADPAGFNNAQIANMMNCTEQTIIYIRQTPQYHAKMLEVATGVVSQYDQTLRENVDHMQDELKSMVPSSMMVIRNALSGKYGGALAFRAATEVLDREGTNAKVSKSTITHEIKPNLDVDPTVASNLMALFASAPATTAEVITGAFTRTAASAHIQEGSMGDTNNTELLEKLDVKNSKPN